MRFYEWVGFAFLWQLRNSDRASTCRWWIVDVWRVIVVVVGYVRGSRSLYNRQRIAKTKADPAVLTLLRAVQESRSCLKFEFS